MESYIVAVERPTKDKRGAKDGRTSRTRKAKLYWPVVSLLKKVSA